MQTSITNQFLETYYTVYTGYKGSVIQELRPRVVCADGFSMSVQASKSHYCMPWINGKNVLYLEVEVGYLSSLTPDFDDYEDWGRAGIYLRVPVEIVDKVILSHGGIDYSKIVKVEED